MNGARLATPGAVLLLVGVVLMWWGAGIFRDENGSLAGGVAERTGRIYNPGDYGKVTPGFGGGKSDNGSGGSGSF